MRPIKLSTGYRTKRRGTHIIPELWNSSRLKTRNENRSTSPHAYISIEDTEGNPTPKHMITRLTHTSQNKRQAKLLFIL